MIAVTDLAKAFGAQTLFEGVSFQLNPGCRYGLVGANGSGKSTLLRILSGHEEASDGTVSTPRRLKVGVLEQDHFGFDDSPILDVVMAGHHALWQAMQAKDELLQQPGEDFDADRYAELEDIIVSHDGYSFEARSGEILEGLGIRSELHRQPLSVLSGGFKLRVLLARVLASDPGIVLLDEPTNHLDILSIRWMEKFLVNYPGCAVVISHDHRFLDNVCTHVLDIDYQTVTMYPGNYTRFIAAKGEERRRREAEIAKREKQIADHQRFVDRFRAKATKARQAQSKVKLIEKTAVESLPSSSRRYPRFRFSQRRPSGKKVIELTGICKAFDDNQVLTDVSLNLRRGDRLAVIGPNGIGKSTLLKILIGELEADSGTLDWGHETYAGYFAQDHRDQLGDSDATVESWLGQACPGEGTGFVRSRLGQVLFEGDEVEKRVAKLSGGEAARLVFARLGVDKPNVMLLDEPTNHLDLEAIEALVQALLGYDGTLLFVSHDRWFVSRLATRILELTPEGFNDYPGSYEEYVARCGDDHLDVDTATLRQRRSRKRGASRKSGSSKDASAERRRRRDLELQREKITASIQKGEDRIEEINGLFCKEAFFENETPERVSALQEEQRKLQTEVDNLMTEWEEIEAKLDGCGNDEVTK